MIAIPSRIARLRPYQGGEQPDESPLAVKLNQNESPYPPAPGVAKALEGWLSGGSFGRYPDSDCGMLNGAISAATGIPSANLLCGNGSSELISLLFRALIGEGETAAVPDPTFGLYAVAAAIAGIRTVPVPTKDDWQIDLDKLAATGAKALLLANPNNPTGTHLPAEAIEQLLIGYRGLVVVDEAYIHFAPETASVLPLVERFDHLLVLRTFSKAYGLSGLRVGFAAGHERLLAAMRSVREPFSVNAVAQLAAEAAVADRDYVRQTAERVIRTRCRVEGELRRLGWSVIPSAANFVLARPEADGPTARQWLEQLASREIYVRHFDTPVLRDVLRISIGTDADMDRVLAVIE